jgi:hypothetical protein
MGRGPYGKAAEKDDGRPKCDEGPPGDTREQARNSELRPI